MQGQVFPSPSSVFTSATSSPPPRFNVIPDPVRRFHGYRGVYLHSRCFIAEGLAGPVAVPGLRRRGVWISIRRRRGVCCSGVCGGVIRESGVSRLVWMAFGLFSSSFIGLRPSIMFRIRPRVSSTSCYNTNPNSLIFGHTFRFYQRWACG